MQKRSCCPICNSEADKEKLRLPFNEPPVETLINKYYEDRVDFSHLQDGAFVINYCSIDDFYWKEYILEQEGMKKLYSDWVPDAHYGARPPNRYNNLNSENTIERASRIKSYFNQHPTKLKVLDYGSGWCYFAQALQYLGFDTYAYEISSDKLKNAEEYNIQTISSQDELSLMEFDYIHASEVLEHVPDPGTTMEIISELLSDEGLCYITVPDANFSGRFSERIITDGVNAFHPLEHINCFTGAAIRQLAGKYGLITTNPPSPTLSHSCVQNQINKIIEKEWIKYPIYKFVNKYDLKKFAKLIYYNYLGGSDRYEDIEFDTKDHNNSEDYTGIDFQTSALTSHTFSDVTISLGKSLLDSDLITNCYFKKK